MRTVDAEVPAAMGGDEMQPLGYTFEEIKTHDKISEKIMVLDKAIRDYDETQSIHASNTLVIKDYEGPYVSIKA